MSQTEVPTEMQNSIEESINLIGNLPEVFMYFATFLYVFMYSMVQLFYKLKIVKRTPYKIVSR